MTPTDPPTPEPTTPETPGAIAYRALVGRTQPLPPHRNLPRRLGTNHRRRTIRMGNRSPNHHPQIRSHQRIGNTMTRPIGRDDLGQPITIRRGPHDRDGNKATISGTLMGYQLGTEEIDVSTFGDAQQRVVPGLHIETITVWPWDNDVRIHNTDTIHINGEEIR